MKNISKRVSESLNKTQKVELSAEKVELQFADRKEQIDRARKNNSDVKEYADKIFRLQEQGKKVALKARDLTERAVRELESDKKEFVSKVKELGINPSSLKQPKEYDEATEEVNTLLKNINKMINDYFK